MTKEKGALRIEVAQLRLKCDACDHQGEEIETTAEAMRAKIGTLCPECGADMLTPEDCEAAIRSIEQINAINNAFACLFPVPADVSADAPEVTAMEFSVNPRAEAKR